MVATDTIIRQRARDMLDNMSIGKVKALIPIMDYMTKSDPFSDENSTFEERVAVFDDELSEVDPADDPFYSEENLKVLRESMEQMKQTGGTIHEVNLDD